MWSKDISGNLEYQVSGSTCYILISVTYPYVLYGSDANNTLTL